MSRGARRRGIAAVAVQIALISLVSACAAGCSSPPRRDARPRSAHAAPPRAEAAIPELAPSSVVDLRPRMEEVHAEPVTMRLAVRRVDASGARGLIAVDATGPHDVWALTEDGRLVRSTGERLVAEPPPCRANPAFSPTSLRISPRSVVLAGWATYETPGIPITRASFGWQTRGSAWRCVDHPGYEVHDRPLGVALLPGVVWAASPTGDDGPTWSTDGVPFALPATAELGRRVVWTMTDRQRGWLLADACDDTEDGCTARAWESRGAGWVPRGELVDAGVADLWIDAQGTPWVAGRYLAFYRDDRWHRIALPEGFVARRVTGGGPDDVWIADAHHLARFDGARLAIATPPIRVADVVFVRGSGLWLVGGPEPQSDGEGGWTPTRGEAAVVTVTGPTR